MSFTDDQKMQIRLALGYPGLFLTQNVRLEGALQTAGNDVAYSAQILSCLAQLLDVDTRISNYARGIAGITGAVGDVEFKAGGALSDLRSEGRIWVGRLSILTGVPILNDIYSPGGYGSDEWQGGIFQNGIFG